MSETKNIPNNMESIENTRMMGLAGLVALGESDSEPAAEFGDGIGNFLYVYADDSVWLRANISEVYPSFGDYLMQCVGDDDKLTAQLRKWAE